MARMPRQPITPTDHAILQRGRYRREDGTEVTFRLPRDGSWPTDFSSSGGSAQGGFNPPTGRTLIGEA